VSDSFDYDLICIGSGPAGQRGAVQAAKLGKRVALIERRTTVGGTCLATGTIPSKTFREAVLHFAAAARPTDGSTRVVQRPSVAELLSRVDEVVAREGAVISNQLSRNGVDVMCGEAAFVDPHRIRVTDSASWREVSAANFLIASGTRAVPLSNVESNGETIITSDDIGALKRLPRSLAVVGAGVIGIEYASMFASLGIEVTVIDRRDRPLEFIDAEIVDELIHQMRKRNVNFRFGEAVEGVTVKPAGPLNHVH